MSPPAPPRLSDYLQHIDLIRARAAAPGRSGHTWLVSNFTFLQAEWPLLHESAVKAESLAHADARAACFYARRTLELTVNWLYKNKRELRLPYQDNLNALSRQHQVNNGAAPNSTPAPAHFAQAGAHAARHMRRIPDAHANLQAGSHAARHGTEKTGLLEASDGERLDTRTAGEAGCADPHLAPVGAIDRTANTGGESKDRQQR